MKYYRVMDIIDYRSPPLDQSGGTPFLCYVIYLRKVNYRCKYTHHFDT